MQFNKSYSSPKERQLRREIFEKNLKYINDFNAEQHSFKVGVNQFADLTNAEFRSLYLSKIASKKALPQLYRASKIKLPDSW